MFKEFYYWVYTMYSERKISKRKWFKGYEREDTYWVISSLLALNFFMVQIIIDYLFIITWHFSFIEILFKGRGKSFVSFLFVGMLMFPVFLYTYFQLDKKRKDILQYYKEKKMSQNRQFWGKFFFWLYVVFTIVLFLGGLLILKNLRSEVEI